MNEFTFEVLRKEDREPIQVLARAMQEKLIEDPIERELASWHARWRDESLEHYLNLGWSLGAWHKESSRLVGFLLAQPILFFEGLTQTLWVEFVTAENLEVEAELARYAFRWAKDKHFQKILFADASKLNTVMTELKGKNFISDIFEVKTARI